MLRTDRPVSVWDVKDVAEVGTERPIQSIASYGTSVGRRREVFGGDDSTAL
jgi:hypothetical protein